MKTQTLLLAATLALVAWVGSADAQVITYYAAPTVTYYAPTPTYYAPTTTYYAPTTTYYAPATTVVPTTTYYVAPVTAYYPVGRPGLFGWRWRYRPVVQPLPY